jgi:hypothetical protein
MPVLYTDVLACVCAFFNTRDAVLTLARVSHAWSTAVLASGTRDARHGCVTVGGLNGVSRASLYASRFRHLVRYVDCFTFNDTWLLADVMPRIACLHVHMHLDTHSRFGAALHTLSLQTCNDDVLRVLPPRLASLTIAHCRDTLDLRPLHHCVELRHLSMRFFKCADAQVDVLRDLAQLDVLDINRWDTLAPRIFTTGHTLRARIAGMLNLDMNTVDALACIPGPTSVAVAAFATALLARMQHPEHVTLTYSRPRDVAAATLVVPAYVRTLDIRVTLETAQLTSVVAQVAALETLSVVTQVDLCALLAEPSLRTALHTLSITIDTTTPLVDVCCSLRVLPMLRLVHVRVYSDIDVVKQRWQQCGRLDASVTFEQVFRRLGPRGWGKSL